MTKYKDQERKRQLECYYNSFFKTVKNCGHWNFYDDNGIFIKRVHSRVILRPEDSLGNLFQPISWLTLDYFKRHNIAWWREDEDRYFPTGHLLSSQIHCLNHLFALRKDKNAVLSIVNHATGMVFDKVLPSSLDNDGGYIAFEFAYNEILDENDKGARRGTFCTSIDAMIEARKGVEKWWIPIEWKYTETYEKEDKTCPKRLERYEDKIKQSSQLIMPKNGEVAHSIYFQEPCYELMRQTLLVEQLIQMTQKSDTDNFFHLNVIPNGNTELRSAVEKCFIPNLKDKSKFRIIDPEDFLSPLKGNTNYKELLDYLETRYWQSL